MKCKPPVPVESESPVVCSDVGIPRIGGHGKRLPKPGRLILLLLLFSSIFVVPSSNFALDPSRSLDQYRLVRWDEDQGLPQNRPDYITQTQDGFIWLGTAGGHGFIFVRGFRWNSVGWYEDRFIPSAKRQMGTDCLPTRPTGVRCGILLLVGG